MKKPEVITVWGNPKFAADFAYNFARKTKKSTLICDLDFLNPSLDILFGVPRNPIRAMGDMSGILHMLEAATNNFLVQAMYDQFSVKRREVPNLHVLTGVYNLAEYEYIDMMQLQKIVKEAVKYYELIVLVVNLNPYDACTAMAFSEGDLVLYPSGSDALSIRYFNNFVFFFLEKQHAKADRFRYVAYIDKPLLGDMEFMKDTTFGNYAGTVSTADSKKMQIMYGALFHKLNLVSNDKHKGEVDWFGGMRREGVIQNASANYSKRSTGL